MSEVVSAAAAICPVCGAAAAEPGRLSGKHADVVPSLRVASAPVLSLVAAPAALGGVAGVAFPLCLPLDFEDCVAFRDSPRLSEAEALF